jgi:cyclophilin family peptidyl-prolyl cis-trans isomerase
MLGPGIAISQESLTSADSALVGRILLAEDRRDSRDVAIRTGMQHGSERIRVIAWRALQRIRDPQFSARDSLPVLQPPKEWAEPAWRLRFRALASQKEDCAALETALADSAWPVRLRAANLLVPACGDNAAIVSTLQRWLTSLPANTERRARGNVSWHAAAHAIVALARIRPDMARDRVASVSRHRQWQLRAYAARAAATLSDTSTLRRLARDANDNVKEVAIEGLSRLTGHADDALYVSALRSDGAQAVRAAALALKDSPNPAVRDSLLLALRRFDERGSESERDVRVAILEALGRTAADDKAPRRRMELPTRAVALALGEDVRIRVALSPGSGGGHFIVRLRGDIAPVMAGRVLDLARAGFYDATTWHRIEHDFVAQGGGHGANEYVGFERYFRDELGNVPHRRGTIGMSTRGHDTGDAQWFINLRDNLRLNRDYTVFAEVVEGMEVVDGMLEGDMIAWMDEVGAKPRVRK